MPAYLIFGPSGTGKSTVQKELANRGFRAIETDNEPGLSCWVDLETGTKLVHSEIIKPFTAEWLQSHVWQWDEKLMQRLLDGVGDEPVFFCGGAKNMKKFMPQFALKFALVIDNDTMKHRLQLREPVRWQDDSPEIVRALRRNKEFVAENKQAGIVFIDSNRPIEAVTADILEHINAQ